MPKPTTIVEFNKLAEQLKKTGLKTVIAETLDLSHLFQAIANDPKREELTTAIITTLAQILDKNAHVKSLHLCYAHFSREDLKKLSASFFSNLKQ